MLDGSIPITYLRFPQLCLFKTLFCTSFFASLIASTNACNNLISSHPLTAEPAEFGENLLEGYTKNEINESSASFEDTAMGYMNEKLDSVEVEYNHQKC